MKHLGVIFLMFIAFSLGMMVGQMSADKRFRELSCYMDDDVLRVGFSRELGEEVVLNGIVITRDGPYVLGGEVIFDVEGITISRIENSELAEAMKEKKA